MQRHLVRNLYLHAAIEGRYVSVALDRRVGGEGGDAELLPDVTCLGQRARTLENRSMTNSCISFNLSAGMERKSLFVVVNLRKIVRYCVNGNSFVTSIGNRF